MPFRIRVAKRNRSDDFEYPAPTSRRGFIVSFILLIALIFTGILAFRGAGRWLIREDQLVHADTIAVLSGSLPYRAERAALLYRQGYAPAVWLTRPDSPAAELSAMGIRYTGDEEYNRDILIHDGVPASAIRILPSVIVDTEDEVREISAEMQNANLASIIIVSSPQHTRRVRALWRRLAAQNQRAIVRAAWEDPFDRDHWWCNTRDAYAVLREFLGLANTWTGLSVRPHSSSSHDVNAPAANN